LFIAIDSSKVEKLENSLGKHLDLRQYLKYHAVTSLINNIDAFRNNFFFWIDEASNPVKIVPWDFDLSFYGFEDVGFYGNNKIIRKSLKNRETFDLYKQELVDLLNTVYLENEMFAIIDSTSEALREAYNVDPFLGGGVYDLDVEVSDLKSFISTRRNFFINNISINSLFCNFIKIIPKNRCL